MKCEPETQPPSPGEDSPSCVPDCGATSVSFLLAEPCYFLADEIGTCVLSSSGDQGAHSMCFNRAQS